MTDRGRAVEAYRAVLSNTGLSNTGLSNTGLSSAGPASGGGTAKAVLEHLTPDVILETNFGRAEGVDAVLALLRDPRLTGLFADGQSWSGSATTNDTVTVTATLPPTAPFGGVECVLAFTGDKISRIEQQTLLALPPTPVPLRLTDEVKDAVNGALDNQTPILVAYSTADGEIHVSYRGTVQAFSDDQLALWARDSSGGLPRNIVTSPKVTFFYHDPKTRTSYTFYGRARIAPAPAERTRVFENSHPRERQMDFRRRGVAIIVALDKVEGRGPSGRVLMLRR
jgi:hypothetical protein